MEFILSNPPNPGNGIITGYAATWSKEPTPSKQFYSKGAFERSIKSWSGSTEGIPLVFGLKKSPGASRVGTVVSLAEDEHGLRFTAIFDATADGQRARRLVKDGRISGVRPRCTVQSVTRVCLKDGSHARQLQKLDIQEIALTHRPASKGAHITTINEGNFTSWNREAPERAALRKRNALLRASNILEYVQKQRKTKQEGTT